MKNRFLFVLWLSASTSLAADFKPFDGPKPVAVLIQSDPWAMVVGADTPRVAIYEGGEVIFAKKINETLAYHHTTLDEVAFADLLRQMRSVAAVKTLKARYDIAGLTDQPEAMFYLRDGARELTTVVYGLWDPETKSPLYANLPGNREAPPNELLQLHKWLCALDSAKSEPWVPKYVEAMLWSYSYAPDPSIHWPKDWPSLKSDRAITRQSGHSIFLDGAVLPKLQKFLTTRKEKGAIELDGKKWAVVYRYTFPSEPTWRAAFSKSDAK
jgi:hypothetical protein